ncbi:hypothetical protein ADEAN_000028400 [Angomonas deanei]|uniref:Uncharacterized protein n=1 Tax=Angomonas deanei TaxID=59799 RepID=A0A7G2C4Q2_9TRYP|nr:hypothetical protein ADEAN_000028400 [Angomonas deanei]
MFVELFSYAVLDWKLQDPKDAQWQGAANFFNDYLQSSTFAVCNSVEEMLHAVTNTHVMVLRALICLCRFDVAQTLRDYNYKYLTSVFTWITQQRTAYSLAQKEGSTAYRTYHPLLHSVIGEELSKLADYIAA